MPPRTRRTAQPRQVATDHPTGLQSSLPQPDDSPLLTGTPTPPVDSLAEHRQPELEAGVKADPLERIADALEQLAQAPDLTTSLLPTLTTAAPSADDVRLLARVRRQLLEADDEDEGRLSCPDIERLLDLAHAQVHRA